MTADSEAAPTPTRTGAIERSPLTMATQRGLDPAERRRVAAALGLRKGYRGLVPFAIMQTLAVVVAVMGMSADSAAVVIGAMLLAPLMVPVLGIAAAISMALPRQILRSLLIVAVASVASVLLAWALARLLPDGALADEVLSRTSPDLRDLLVALAAGAAGAYATVRPDVSSSLPGVAVAVALVPPLAALGMTIEAGRSDLATGAALLYTANLSAIVMVGLAVFLLTGFVPPRRLRQKGLRVVGGGLLVAGITAAIAVPLTIASVNASADGRERDRVQTAVTAWLQGTGDEIDEVRIDGDVVRVSVSGPTAPGTTADLERALRQILGPDATAEVRWIQTQAPPSRTEDTATTISGAERLETEVATAVDRWLEPLQSSWDVEGLDVSGDEVRIDLVSAEPPPPLEDLADPLRDELGIVAPVVVDWTRRTTIRPGDGDDGSPGGDTIDGARRRLDAAAADWARTQPGTQVLEVSFDGEQVVVEVAAPSPGDTSALRAALSDEVPPGTPVLVWLTRRELVVPDLGGSDG